MRFIRKLLFPFAIIYWLVTSMRNRFYNNGLFKSKSWPLPVIAVGNLSMGGTGKTPMVEYIIRRLYDNYNIAILSRGYKRRTKGFVLADHTSDAAMIGDEPFQYYTNFPKAKIAVDADRNNGIAKLLEKCNPEVIVLDDAFQHRKVKAGLYILLTVYDDLYADDYILPVGNLREPATGAERASIVIVTKCPPLLSASEQQNIKKKLALKPFQKLYFTSIKYASQVFSETNTIPVNSLGKKLLVAGIARPQPFIDHLRLPADEVLIFPDHHNFSDSDIQMILEKADGNAVVTTQKDFVRLRGRIPVGQLFYLPIETAFLEQGDSFNSEIIKFVENFERY